MDEELIRDLIREQAAATQALRDLDKRFDDFGSRFADFEKRLFGNGQPGALAYLDKKINEVDSRLDEQSSKVTELDKRQAVFSVKTHSLSAGLGATGAALLEWASRHLRF